MNDSKTKMQYEDLKRFAKKAGTNDLMAAAFFYPYYVRSGMSMDEWFNPKKYKKMAMKNKKSDKVTNYRLSQVRSKNTRLEHKIFDILSENGIVFLRHDEKLPGKPDIVFEVSKVAIFIDSDFWHGWKLSEWKHKLSPYWLNKITNNVKRDRLNNRKLKELGWKVLRIKEHQIKKDIDACIDKILRLSKQNDNAIV